MRSRLWGVVGLAVLLTGLVHATPIEEIPSPRPHGWVTDLVGVFDSAASERINRLADMANAHDGAEVAVVVIDTTDGLDARDYATELFNYWGIGDPVRNNGVLLFAALDDRAAEIILGEGIDDAAHIAIAEQIMAQRMVPHFRNGNPQGALAVGASAIVHDLLGVPREAGKPLQLEVERPVPQPLAPAAPRPAPTDSSSGESSSIVPLGIMALIVWLVVKVVRRRPAPAPAYDEPERRSAFSVLGGLLGAAGANRRTDHRPFSGGSSGGSTPSGFGGGRSAGRGASSGGQRSGSAPVSSPVKRTAGGKPKTKPRGGASGRW